MVDSDNDPDAPLPQDMDEHDEPDVMPCPHCRKMVIEDAWECPHCHRELTVESNKSMILILIICFLILVTSGIVIFGR